MKKRKQVPQGVVRAMEVAWDKYAEANHMKQFAKLEQIFRDGFWEGARVALDALVDTLRKDRP